MAPDQPQLRYVDQCVAKVRVRPPVIRRVLKFHLCSLGFPELGLTCSRQEHLRAKSFTRSYVNQKVFLLCSGKCLRKFFEEFTAKLKRYIKKNKILLQMAFI